MTKIYLVCHCAEDMHGVFVDSAYSTRLGAEVRWKHLVKEHNYTENSMDYCVIEEYDVL